MKKLKDPDILTYWIIEFVVSILIGIYANKLLLVILLFILSVALWYLKQPIITWFQMKQGYKIITKPMTTEDARKSAIGWVIAYIIVTLAIVYLGPEKLFSG